MNQYFNSRGDRQAIYVSLESHTQKAMDARMFRSPSYSNNASVALSKSSARKSGPLYTITASNGDKVLLNASTMVAETTLQFMPIRTKVTSNAELATETILDRMNFNEVSSGTSLLRTPTAKYCNQLADGNGFKKLDYPLFSAIKGFFISLLRPIINTNVSHLTFPKSFEMAKTIDVENLMINPSIQESQSTHIDSSTFFDCDDYVDNEDAVDFIAQSFSRCDAKPIISDLPDLSPSEFYDCIGSSLQEMDMNSNSDKTIDHNEQQKSVDKTFRNKHKIKSKKYSDEFQTMANDNKRKQGKRKRRNNNNNNKSQRNCNSKSLTSDKNHHEKFRHQLVMDIHDDIFDCIHGYASDTWTEANDTIDFTDTFSPKVATEASDSSCSENILPCSGSLFTCFIPLGGLAKRANRVSQRVPSRCLQRWPSFGYSSCDIKMDKYDVDETDDGRVSMNQDLAFETHSRLAAICPFRERQISECSDDFICFEYNNDENDDAANAFYDTADDESYNSDASSDNGFHQEHELMDHYQPDSGVEEKKVNCDPNSTRKV